jgi:uncharacterized BrkB/YihY/UPF0761 family membrane protein
MPIFAYYLPSPIELHNPTRSSLIRIAYDFKTPVIIDPFTLEVFLLDPEDCDIQGNRVLFDYTLPMKDYPLILTEREAFEIIVGTASNVSKSLTVFFIITVLLSCSTLLNQMSKDGDYIYGREGRKKGVFRRLWALLLLCVLFLLFIAFALCFSFRNSLLLRFGQDQRNLLTIISFALIIIFAFIIIMLLNGFISPIKLSPFSLFFGSFISLCITVVGTICLILYIRYFSNYNAFYGSLAGVVVFFLWAFILMLALALGSFFCMRLSFKGKRGNLS